MNTTEEADLVLKAALEKTKSFRLEYAGSGQLFWAIVSQPECLGYKKLASLGANLEELEREIDSKITIPGHYGDDPKWSNIVEEIFELAKAQAKRLNTTEVTTVHLLFAILKNGITGASRMLSECATGKQLDE